jgi:uncharacterized repeat protein (TIGR03803 family)
MTEPEQQRSRILGIRLQSAMVALVLTMLFLLGGVATQSAEAQTFTLLYRFGGANDGLDPTASLVRDAAGDLYGTTSAGLGTSAYGTVFKLDASGKETILYAFTGGTDGATPYGGLVRDAAGNLYGTTLYGGKGKCTGGLYPGCGTVFKVNKAGKETVLHSFTNGADGGFPQAGLIRDAAGNFYGTAQSGGRISSLCPYGCGTVFELALGSNRRWKATVLHTFSNTPDGASPISGLVMDAAGNLYGTTQAGGTAYYGTVFRLSKSGKMTILHSFSGLPDGRQPYAGVVRDTAGNLYGTTGFGGSGDYGAVFEVTKTGHEAILYSFPEFYGDGDWLVAGLALDSAGNLYGATMQGGAEWGILFKLDKTGKETILHTFNGQADGDSPAAALIGDGAGNFYGTNEGGAVFKITP